MGGRSEIFCSFIFFKSASFHSLSENSQELLLQWLPLLIVFVITFPGKKNRLGRYCIFVLPVPFKYLLLFLRFQMAQDFFHLNRGNPGGQGLPTIAIAQENEKIRSG